MAKIICENRIDFDLQLYVYLIKAKAIVMNQLFLKIFKEKNILMTTEFKMKMNSFKVKLINF